MLAVDIAIGLIAVVTSACLWNLEYYGLSILAGIVAISMIGFILYTWRKR